MTVPHRWSGLFRTLDGSDFDILNPRSELIDPATLATALSNLCRFNGHVPVHYSVAQHCVHVSDLLAPEHALAGLLHDAPEALGLGDVISPLKRHVTDFHVIERRVARAVCSRFGLEPEALEDPAVKHADLVMLHTEFRDLRGQGPHLGMCTDVERAPFVVDPWPATHARARWLQRLSELWVPPVGASIREPDLGTPWRRAP